MFKQRTGRIRAEENQMFEQHQAKTGETWNAFLHRAIRTMLGQPEANLDSVDEVTGSAATVLFESGTLFNWDEKKRRKIDSRQALYCVAEGYLWLVDRTRNYSHRILKKVCKVPEVLLQSQAASLLKQWVLSGIRNIFSSLQTITELAKATWFQAKRWRGDAEYILQHAVEGDTIEQLTDEYAPTVEEVTAPVEKPTVTRLSKQQLKKVYNIAIDIWQQQYSKWRSNGYQSPDGIWNWNTAENVWVLSNG